VINFFQLLPELRQQLFARGGDHADESETSLMLHLHPQLVDLHHAGAGERRPAEVDKLDQPGVWTPRPWSHVHPDTGSGDPRAATAVQGERYFAAMADAIAEIILAIDRAVPGQIPFCV
jgi:creatinine amidohydrolase